MTHLLTAVRIVLVGGLIWLALLVTDPWTMLLGGYS